MDKKEYYCSTQSCNIQRLSIDQVYQCTECDHYFCSYCYQTTGRDLTQDELGDEYDEDDPLWYCNDCAIID